MDASVHIAGVGSTRFGFPRGRSLQSLAADAPREALTSAMTAAIDQTSEGRAGLTFPGFWGMIMARHMHLYGTTREQVAAVTVKNRQFGTRNPLAQFQNAVSVEEVIASPPMA